MKIRSSSALLTAVAMLMASTLHAQSGFLDRLKERADELADTAEEVGQDVDTVINADEVAADRVDNAGRQAELEAEHDVRNTVEATAPVSAARSAERELRDAERGAARIAQADDLAEAEARRRADPRPEVEETGNALQRARRALRDLV